MRFALDIAETGRRRFPATKASNSVSKADVEWVPLQNHPLFSPCEAADFADEELSNLIAWDESSSRLYFWDVKDECLHRISVRLGEPDPSSVIAASPSKLLRPDVPLDFEVNKITINREGSAMLLVGVEGVQVVDLYGRTSVEENAIICRNVSIGSEIYFIGNNPLTVLQISWHPCSNMHVGILSSDSVFRIFDLSIDIGKPEQEFYLEPLQRSKSTHAAALCPVDFSFGGDRMWDRFSVFILFSDGSCFIICAVVPFGSVYKWESILELYHDTQATGLKSSDPNAVNNACTAISWLEATFPDLVQQHRYTGKPKTLKARPFVFSDSSVALQGPLSNIHHGMNNTSGDKKAVFEGHAVSFLYNLVGKDSILITSWGGGQLQIDALADEIQPLWNSGSAPKIYFGSSDQVLSAATICEPPKEKSLLKLDDPSAWLGHPPPLLRLAVVDLALSKKPTSTLAMIPDPLDPKRVFCVHAGGIDSIILHFLPFTSITSSKKERMRPPSVLPVLTTGTGDDVSLPPPLCGCLPVLDPFGNSWIFGITSANECVVLQMETILRSDVDKLRETLLSDGEKMGDIETPYTIISQDLLVGPKPILLPALAATSSSVSADSIEGRSMLNQYFTLVHENYVDYAYKVYFELQHHGPQVKKMLGNQVSRIQAIQNKLLDVEQNHEKIEDQIDEALKQHSALEDRLLRLKNLPGLHKKPLSKAERDFKSELDRLIGIELGALHSAIEALNARLKKHQLSQGKTKSPELRTPIRNPAEDEMQQLKSSLEKLSLLNSENNRKVKLIESTLKRSKESID